MDEMVQKYISADPEICHGKPCFKGTRLMVWLVLELLESGQSAEEIIDDYPDLTKGHIQAALHLAARVLENDKSIAFA